MLILPFSKHFAVSLHEWILLPYSMKRQIIFFYVLIVVRIIRSYRMLIPDIW